MSVFDAIATGDDARVAAIVRDDPAAATARDADGVSALLQAKYHGNDRALAVLRDAVADLDFFEACALGDFVRVEELVDGDPTLVRAFALDGFTGLTLAAFFGHPEVVRLLLDRGADPNLRATHRQIQVKPIHAGSAGNVTEIVRQIVDAGAEIDETQPSGSTALMSAAQNGNLELVEFLLERGADPAKARDDGKTALDFAREAGHADVAARLERA